MHPEHAKQSAIDTLAGVEGIKTAFGVVSSSLFLTTRRFLGTTTACSSFVVAGSSFFSSFF
jgi:formylmethanofuran:tetrahydromethanopterin formyltransferase